jgi:hypothetical protein
MLLAQISQDSHAATIEDRKLNTYKIGMSSTRVTFVRNFMKICLFNMMYQFPYIRWAVG